ncbi:hypothetical protein EST38_g10508 [Candolleomyces aberdarensis]|uniref:NACHT domain-containing protein n=1 Tax=Candolleomyces aberdarensis TaxID=2316362 RepID=A0A4Q2D772_9AGAR|nr:hypothetical protein EST38_g10508 [Candolleomyces aberdarensis]
MAQPIMNAQGYEGSGPVPVYQFGGFNAYSSNPEGILAGQTYGRNDSTYHVGGYGRDGLDAEAPHTPTSHVTVASSVVDMGFRGDIGSHSMPAYDAYPPLGTAAQPQPAAMTLTPALKISQNDLSHPNTREAQGLEGFEQGYGVLAYGPIPHTSIQLASSMCFRAQRRTVDNRSAPYSIVNRQERNRGTIYNGNIYGGVNSFNMSNSDGAVLQYLNERAATGAMHDSDERFPPPLCHPGTREAVIYRILDWYGYQRGPGKPIMWVHAPAGYGKTAIAGTVAEKLEEKLIELFSSPIPELAPHIENAVKRNPMILTKALEVQMKKLIVEPFKALGTTQDMPNRLIIIDGLDECINSDRESRIEKKYAEDRESVQIRVLDLILALALHQLPLSFLILSRPEAWIKECIESQHFKDVVEFVDLYEVGDHMQDVETFVKAELSHLGLDEEVLVKRLVLRANGHMLYASTVIRHIEPPYDDPRKRLQNILDICSSSNPDLAHSTPFSSLHELYRQILRSCPEGNRSVMIEVLEDIDAAVLSFRREVGMDRAVNILDHLSGRVPGAGMKAIRGLHAVLNLTGGGKKDRMGNERPYLEYYIHSSFHPFLRDPRLSLEFYVDGRKGCLRLLSRCLHHMSSITLHSKVDADHLRFAVLEWMCLWLGLVDPPLGWQNFDNATLLAMLQKLLDIDLTACFVHAFTHLNGVIYLPTFGSTILETGANNGIVPQSIDGANLHKSEPLAQQAVLHVRGSYKAAVLHLLKVYLPCTDQYKGLFIAAVSLYLIDLSRPSEKSADWNSDGVVHALKALKQESSEHFEMLMEDVNKNFHERVRMFGDAEHFGNSEVLISFIYDG